MRQKTLGLLVIGMLGADHTGACVRFDLQNSLQLLEGLGHGLSCQEQARFVAPLPTPAEAAGTTIAPQLEGSYQGVSVSILDEAQATLLFEHFRKLSHIPGAYLEDGCYARSHELALIAAQMGVKMGKVFAAPKANGALLFPSAIAKERFDRNFSGWRYHTAPFVLVKNSAGETVPFVFDYGIAAQARPIFEWERSMSQAAVDLTFRDSEHLYRDGEMRSNSSILGCLQDDENLIKKMGWSEFDYYRNDRKWL